MKCQASTVRQLRATTLTQGPLSVINWICRYDGSRRTKLDLPKVYVMSSPPPTQATFLDEYLRYLPLALFGAALTLVGMGFMLIGGGALAPGGSGFLLPAALIFEGIVVADIAWWVSGRRAVREAAIK